MLPSTAGEKDDRSYEVGPCRDIQYRDASTTSAQTFANTASFNSSSTTK